MNIQELRKLNFDKILRLGIANIDQYDFPVYQSNKNEHMSLNGFCIECNKENCHLAPNDPGFELKNVSHGAHSSDFFKALNPSISTTGWNDTPVMFIYESPSLDYGIYKKNVAYSNVVKNPSKDWYWIHGSHTTAEYPTNFAGGIYTPLVLSAMATIKMSNFYVTNLVKCGMANDAGNYVGIDKYDPKCIELCYSEILKEEIRLMEPRVIYTFGSGTEWRLINLCGPNPPFFIQQLPHPAGRRRGFRDQYYLVLYFWLIIMPLVKTKVISQQAAEKLGEMFIKNYPY